MKYVNLQEAFLNSLRRNQSFVTVFLLNGFQLKGSIRSYDNFTILLEVEGKQHLIYKHAISTFAPAKNITFNGEDDDSD